MNGKCKIHKKNCHIFCWVHRIDGIQNDQLQLFFLKRFKKQCLVASYICKINGGKRIKICKYLLQRHIIFPSYFSKNDHEIEPAVSNTINQIKSEPCVSLCTFQLWKVKIQNADIHKVFYTFFSAASYRCFTTFLFMNKEK